MNNRTLSTREAANFTRSELAEAIRRNPYEVNSLLAGFDKEPVLYWLDYLGTLQKVNYGCHGYPSYMVHSIFHEFWKPGMSQEECINVLRKRFIISQNNFVWKIVDKDGHRELNL